MGLLDDLADTPQARYRRAQLLMANQWDRAVPEVVQRHSVLPLAEYDNGKIGPAVPGLLEGLQQIPGDLYRALTGRMTSTPVYTEETVPPPAYVGQTSPEMIGLGNNIAGTMATGGGAVPKPTNAVVRPHVLAANSSRSAAPGVIMHEAGKEPFITAYHGSPHDFDRFSMDKIGTGEGAQAYGNGLYFAEREGVAKSYRDALGDARHQMPKPRNADEKAVQDALAEHVKLLGDGGWDDMPNLRHAIINEMEHGRIKETALDTFDALAKEGRIPSTLNRGHMYQVRINADPEHFLDWDKPLSQQSENVRGAVMPLVQKAFHSGKYGRPELLPEALSGDDAITAISAGLGNADRTSAASAALRDAGIPGIKYLDQGSRTAGEGSRNYVVFDDKLIDILKKYGLIGLLGGAPAGLGLMQPEQQSLPGMLGYRG